MLRRVRVPATIAFVSRRAPARSPAATPRSSISSARSLWSVLARWSGDHSKRRPHQPSLQLTIAFSLGRELCPASVGTRSDSRDREPLIPSKTENRDDPRKSRPLLSLLAARFSLFGPALE